MVEPTAGWHSHSRVLCWLVAGHHCLFTQEKCPQSSLAVAPGAFSSLNTFQSHEQDGDWEERGAMWAGSQPSSVTVDPVGGTDLE